MTHSDQNSLSELQLMMFDHCIKDNCRIAIDMFEKFFELIENEETRQRIEGFALLHAGLSATAIISKCFFPVKSSGTKEFCFSQFRSKYLLERYDLSDQSSIRDRYSRDNFEHFDERIDTFPEGGVLNGVFTQATLDYLGDRWVLGRVFVICDETIRTRNKKGETHQQKLRPLLEELRRISAHPVSYTSSVVLTPR